MADIEIVIDMPEEKYKWIKENNPKADKNSIIGAIIYGTPLPKGHGRLIDTDEIHYCHVDGTDYALKEEILSVPTIIEADKESKE